MHPPGTMWCGITSVLLLGGILFLNPMIGEPRAQLEAPAFDPADFRACVDICRIDIETCFIECNQGGSPPEFGPGPCMSSCQKRMADCLNEVCWRP